MTQATEKDIGKWCKFWDNGYIGFEINKLAEISENIFINYSYEHDYDNCTPLTQEQIKCLELEE